jgi:hypothetical protein
VLDGDPVPEIVCVIVGDTLVEPDVVGEFV